MVDFKGFVAPSNAGLSLAVTAERTINMTVQENEGQKGTYYLRSMPGLRQVAALPSGPIRALYEATNSRVFIATSTTIFELFSGYTYVSRGTIPTGTSVVSMIDNGTQLLISANEQAFVLDFATNVLTPVPAGGPPTFGRVQYIAGWFVTHQPNSRTFWYSDLLNGLSWPALNFYNADSRADNITTLIVDHNELWLIGTQTIEIWLITGNALSPFARSSSTFLELGSIAPWSVAALDSTIFWLGGSPRGLGPAYRARGYEPQRISNHAFEVVRSKVQVPGSAIAFTARQGGSAYYGVWWPDSETTWLWDNLLSTWVELAALNEDGSLGPYPCNTHCLAFNDHLWGSYSDGSLYVWDVQWHRYGQKERYCARISPHIRNDQKPVVYSKFELVCQAGVGLDDSPPVGADPVVRLSWSDDAGGTWSYPLERSLGKIGKRQQQVIFRRLGRAKHQRTFRCVITDPVPVTLIAASLDVQ